MEPTHKMSWGYISLVIVVIILVLGGLVFYVSNNHTGQDATNTAELISSPDVALSSASPFVEPTPAIAGTGSGGNYSLPEVGISFKYPATWQGFKLEKIVPSSPQSDVQKGTAYISNSVEFSEPYIVSIHSKDYFFYANPTPLNKRKVDVNWNKQQFASNMGVTESNVLLVKKLSSKSVLVGLYASLECSPSMLLKVLTPLNDAYPNFEVDVIEHSDLERQLSEDYIKSQTEKGLDICDQSAIFQQLADKVANGTYSTTLDAKIKTAQSIAESVQITK